MTGHDVATPRPVRPSREFCLTLTFYLALAVTVTLAGVYALSRGERVLGWALLLPMPVLLIFLAHIYQAQAAWLKIGKAVLARIVEHQADRPEDLRTPTGSPGFYKPIRRGAEDFGPLANVVYEFQIGGETHRDGYLVFRDDLLRDWPVGKEFVVLYRCFEGTVMPSRLWMVKIDERRLPQPGKASSRE